MVKLAYEILKMFNIIVIVSFYVLLSACRASTRYFTIALKMRSIPNEMAYMFTY